MILPCDCSNEYYALSDLLSICGDIYHYTTLDKQDDYIRITITPNTSSILLKNSWLGRYTE